MDSQEICLSQVCLKIRQPDAHKILFRGSANGDIVISPLDAFNTGRFDGHDPGPVADEDS